MILKEMVLRFFGDPESQSYEDDVPKWASIADIIDDILTQHANGIHFRERNAGREIDDRMQDEGFNVDIVRDPETGFVFGGNPLNCGTWMDKMGSSTKAGNCGIPATPRDGADVEIVALQHAVLRHLAVLHKEGWYPHAGVNIDGKHLLTFDAWANSIERNFHKCFYVPMHKEDDAAFDINEQYVNKRGIFKDCYRSSAGWTDYQLRPNFLVAMAANPELFEAHHNEATLAVQIAQKQLCGPLGMRTLDKDDWAYRGDYHNDDDSTDRAVAAGFNYHQGPEWVWPFGCFLQALITFGKFSSNEERDAAVYTLLQPHVAMIQSPPWHSLPELTNSNGSFCHGSCRSQAWSFATILEALYLLHNLDNKSK